MMHLLWLLYSGLCLLYFVVAYDPGSRWGHSVITLGDALYVHGGKVDQFNQYSYTSAPNTNETLYLSLSSTFSTQAPPWTLVSSDGPPVAWHSLSACNSTSVLLFGGEPDPNSPSVLPNAADSATFLDLPSRTSLLWSPQPSSWANQPLRRIRHTSVALSDDLIFIFGGTRADGSQIAFSDHFYFVCSNMTFNLIPTANAPPDLHGHASIILPNGLILVFGGYSPSQNALLPLSTIWVLDTSTMQWDIVTTDTSSLPSPRMAFAAVYISSGRIIIHGGCDSSFQTNFVDGWILDTTKNPWTWTRVEPLSQLGARRDHFAVAIGDQVFFGFGYLSNGPATPALQVYSPSSNSFIPAYSPPPASVTATHSRSRSSQLPTTSRHSTSPNYPTSTTTPGGGRNNTIAIALGSVFGILGLIGVGLAAAYCVRRRRRKREGRFMALSDEDGDTPRPIPAAKMHTAPAQRGILGSLGPLSTALIRKSARSMVPRRDMLADEDEQSFREWYNDRRSITGSAWSLKSILGAPKMRSRQASSGSTEWKEKSPEEAGRMRDEEIALINAVDRPPNRRSRQEPSNQSWMSKLTYRDPFADPSYDDAEVFDSADLYKDHGHIVDNGKRSESSDRPHRPSARLVPNVPPLQSVLPISQGGHHQLSPLLEHPSQSTLPSQNNTSASNSSHGHSANDYPPNSVDSPSVPPRTTSIINSSDSSLLSGSQQIRRTDSWWTRFSRTAFIDRRSSSASQKMFDLRDPNPPPQLGPIEERTSQHGSIPSDDKLTRVPQKLSARQNLPSSSQKLQPIQDRRNLVVPYPSRTRIYEADKHGKSMSSLRTADSEAIERMGTMDVVQIMKSRSQSQNRSSVGGLSVETYASTSAEEYEDREYRNAGPHEREGQDEDNLIMFTSPVNVEPTTSMFRHPLADDEASSRADTAVQDDKEPVSPSSNVASRVLSYERRMSMEAPVSPPPTNTRHREERSKKRVEVKYGLAPRPSLFVANPDRTASSDS